MLSGSSSVARSGGRHDNLVESAHKRSFVVFPYVERTVPSGPMWLVVTILRAATVVAVAVHVRMTALATRDTRGECFDRLRWGEKMSCSWQWPNGPSIDGLLHELWPRHLSSPETASDSLDASATVPLGGGAGFFESAIVISSTVAEPHWATRITIILSLPCLLC
jgi:hypothetical protein